jgi:hypothetical protein
MTMDLEIKCGEGSQVFFQNYVALPSLAVWCKFIFHHEILGLGIPAFAFFKMYKRRNELGKQEVKEMFGFLYNGYKKHAFYWEIVIMYRKICIIFISVFLNKVSKVVQVNLLL